MIRQFRRSISLIQSEFAKKVFLPLSPMVTLRALTSQKNFSAVKVSSQNRIEGQTIYMYMLF
jgi:hypothetical protein